MDIDYIPCSCSRQKTLNTCNWRSVHRQFIKELYTYVTRPCSIMPPNKQAVIWSSFSGYCGKKRYSSNKFLSMHKKTSWKVRQAICHKQIYKTNKEDLELQSFGPAAFTVAEEEKVLTACFVGIHKLQTQLQRLQKGPQFDSIFVCQIQGMNTSRNCTGESRNHPWSKKCLIMQNRTVHKKGEYILRQ